MADVEKRLNSSLADLITQAKGSGGRGGKAPGRGGKYDRGGRTDRGKGGPKRGATAKESQGKASDKRQAVLAQKRGLQQPAGGNAQKKGSTKGRTLALPVSKSSRGGRAQSRGAAGRRGRGGRGPAGGGRGQLGDKQWNPASLKITIKNDKYMQSAPSRPTFLEGPADAYTGSGMASGSSCFPQQRVSPLTFAAGLPMSIGGARARAPYTTNGLYNAATAAAAQQQQQRTNNGTAQLMAWTGQAARNTGMPGSGLRMDAEYRR